MTGIPASLADGDDGITEAEALELMEDQGYYDEPNDLRGQTVTGNVDPLMGFSATPGDDFSQALVAIMDRWTTLIPRASYVAGVRSIVQAVAGTQFDYVAGGRFEVRAESNGPDLIGVDVSATRSAADALAGSLTVGVRASASLYLPNGRAETSHGLLATASGGDPTDIPIGAEIKAIGSSSGGSPSGTVIKAVATDVGTLFSGERFDRDMAEMEQVFSVSNSGVVRTAGSYEYTSPRERGLMLPTQTFVTANDAGPTLVRGAAGLYFDAPGAQLPVQQYATAPILLPSGSVVRAIQCWAVDNQTDGLIEVQIVRPNLATGVYDSLGTVTFSQESASASPRALQVTLSTPFTINDVQSYLLLARLRSNSVVSTRDTLTLRACRLLYDVTTL